MKNSEFISHINIQGNEYQIFDINILEKKGLADISKLPFSIKILVENLLRKLDGRLVREEDLFNIARWKRRYETPQEIPYHPARVLMQDFTGVPAVVDLAAMRDAMKDLGKPLGQSPSAYIQHDHKPLQIGAGTGKELRNKLERNIVDTQIAHVFKTAAQHRLPGTGQAGDHKGTTETVVTHPPPPPPTPTD